MEHVKYFASRSVPTAVLGAGLWVLSVAITQPTWRGALLLFSPFVLIPLGITVAAAESPLQRTALVRLARLAPLGAVGVAASYLAPEGAVAAALCLPWLTTSALIAAIGASRLGHRPRAWTAGLGLDVGLVYLVVGAGWLVLWRAGAQPMGFGSDIVGLTAVHFHYAGFALPIVAGAAAIHRNSGPFVPAAVVVGVPLTALGITVGGVLEWVAATVMALAGLAVAASLLRLVTRTSGVRRAAMVVAGIALTLGMALALGWAWSMALGWRYLGLDAMVRSHGTLNALGFGLFGLASLAGLPFTGAHPGAMMSSIVHLGRPSAAELEALASSAADEAPTAPIGMVHASTPPGYRRDRWTRPAAHGDLDLARRAITSWAAQRSAGVILSPATPDIAVGVTLAFAYPVGPGSVTGTCRITEVIDEPDRFGFVYATLPHHPEQGEELFLVERERDGVTTAAVEAVWRPANVFTRLGLPLTRFFQLRATRRYLDGLTARPTDHTTRP